MSRCFVFPAPGYVTSRPEQAVNEAVLKVKEKHRDKKERREKKKEKKRAKKREKRLEHGEEGPVVSEKQKHRHQKKHEHNKDDKIVVLSTLTKAKEDAELLERSCITEEEHEQAIGVQNQSPDSLDRSSSGLSGLKRALDSSGGVSVHDSKRQKITPIEKGKGLLIRLPVKNTEHQQQAAAKQVRPCIIIKPPVATAAAAAAREDLGASTLHHTPLCPPDVGKTGGDEAGTGDKITRSHPESPPPLPKLHVAAPPGDDMEWLVKRKCSGETVREERKEKTLIWLRRCYLPSIDMHALPCVLPY